MNFFFAITVIVTFAAFLFNALTYVEPPPPPSPPPPHLAAVLLDSVTAQATRLVRRLYM
jgi:hypothetical protein